MSDYSEGLKLNLSAPFFGRRIVILVAALIILHVVSTEIARSITYYLAVYVTDSIAPRYYIGSPYDYELIYWDEKLKKMAYGIFGAIFLIEIIVMHLVLKIKKRISKPAVYITAGLFILSFPTITNWYISTSCDGPVIFYSYCSKALYVVTPLIMSDDPIFIIISFALAFLIAKIYFKFCWRTIIKFKG